MDLTPQSPWLKATDFEDGEEKVFTIKSVVEQEVGPEKEVKNVLSFKETDKKIVLGAKTLINALIAAAGTSESDEMPGKKLTLYVDDNVRNPNGGTCSAVRIKAKAPKGGSKAASGASDNAGSNDKDLGFGG